MSRRTDRMWKAVEKATTLRFSQQIVRSIPGMVSIATGCVDWKEEQQTQMQIASAHILDVSQPCWMHDDLLRILQRYEGAVNEAEGQGNDSNEAVTELEDARTALLILLRKARGHTCMET